MTEPKGTLSTKWDEALESSRMLPQGVSMGYARPTLREPDCCFREVHGHLCVLHTVLREESVVLHTTGLNIPDGVQLSHLMDGETEAQRREMTCRMGT